MHVSIDQVENLLWRVHIRICKGVTSSMVRCCWLFVKGKRKYLSDFKSKALIIALILLACNLIISQHDAQAASLNTYSCLYPHCYGIEDWPGGMDGGHTSIKVAHISPGDEFVTNEMWIDDKQTSGGPYWVEGGYLTNVNVDNGAELWFWADNRPGGGYNAHYATSPVTSGDYGNPVNVTIVRGSSNPNTHTFTVQVYGTSTGIAGSSTYNSMVPNDINIGEELYGSSGASASTALWAYNQYRPTGTYNFRYQHVLGHPGTNEVNNPPWSGWSQNVNPTNSSYGGNWYACTLPSSGKNPC